MELGEERFHPGAGALAHASPRWSRGELGRVAPGKAIAMQTNLFSSPSGLSWAGFTPAVM